MAQTKSQIQKYLEQAGTGPRQRFGQNFMIDQNLVRLIAQSAQLTPDDVVIEVGPGTGTLTEELLSRAGRVIAVEIDRDLAKLLLERFGAQPKFKLIEGDVLEGKYALNRELEAMVRAAVHEAKPVKLVANLPYNIASPLIIELLIAGVGMLVFTVQKEVAERLRAGAGEQAYGPLSVIAQLLAEIELLRTLPPQVFWPAPKVDSALVRMIRQDRLGSCAADFSRFVHRVFAYRRKTLRRAMAQAGYDPMILQVAGVDPQLRPENLTPQQFLALFQVAASSKPQM
ncbi:16S rRNA (adenine(1518)-N(6)/adenine(1519)-N(6))-dimethyltransferase RsmA [Fontivita pretiosa]|uniref:16S rRNA (adenine(1518)-N(6)/adenine(1519)-N(6))- dimethyltransferase RsmA n=1 Tax=Fontivita pretiosa TaxID=2989684 RepID=UPI003D167F6E